MGRTLRLRKDTLAELSTEELRELGGGTLFSPQEFRIPTRERCIGTVSDAICYTWVAC